MAIPTGEERIDPIASIIIVIGFAIGFLIYVYQLYLIESIHKNTSRMVDLLSQTYNLAIANAGVLHVSRKSAQVVLPPV
jgi:hypothetical protein